MDRRKFIEAGLGAAFVSSMPMSSPAFAARKHAATHAPLTVGSDPRIELYSVILTLSPFRGFPGAPVVTELDFSYRTEVGEYFGTYGEHPVVAKYAAMAAKGFRFGHPPSAILHFTDPPALEPKASVDPLTLKMAGGAEELDAFIALARDFAHATDFMTWFGSHADFYRGLADTYRARMEWNYVDDLVEYYGEARESYTMMLAPLFHPGGFGPRVRRDDGRYEAYAAVGPRAVEDGVPAFGAGAAARRMQWHEFSHSHVNHLTDANIDGLIEPVSILQKDVKAEVEAFLPWSIHVADWVSEHVVRGVTTRLAYRKTGDEEGAAALAKEMSSFPYVDRVAALLEEEYETDRRKYPTLAAFFPNIVTLFSKIAAA